MALTFASARLQLDEIVSAFPDDRTEMTIQAVAITIEPRLTGPTLERFAIECPLERHGLLHLKRVRKDRADPTVMEIVVVPESEFSSLAPSVQEFCRSFPMTTVEVGKYPPRNRAEFEQLTTLWPLNFHPSQLEKVRAKGFSSSELDAIHANVKQLEEEERKILALYPSYMYSDAARSGGGGALIVNPENGKIVASASSALEYLTAADSCCSIRSSGSSGNSESSGSSSGIALGSSTTAGSSSTLTTTVQQHPVLSHPLYTPTMLCVDLVGRKVATEVADEEESLPPNFYLCSGLDLYVGTEPDCMACMALVHSRIGRVFYLRSAAAAAAAACSGSDGGLESRASGGIHDMRALNHHYRAFRAKILDNSSSSNSINNSNNNDSCTNEAGTATAPVEDESATPAAKKAKTTSSSTLEAIYPK